MFNKLFKPKNNEEIKEKEEIEIKEEYSEELIAVISAAIAALTNKPASDFKVVLFKERKNWNLLI